MDKQMMGRIGFVDIDANNPLKVLNISEKAVLDIGMPGTFDDSGVTPSCIVTSEGKILLYYNGWQRGVRVRYFLLSGLAVSDNAGNFQRYTQVPILERSNAELYFRCAPYVIMDNGIYRMWYIGGREWVSVKNKDLPHYNVRYMESTDGVNWDKQGKVCLDTASEDEHGFGRPWVIKDGGIYKMWYSIRTKSKGYRIGYAESPDGLNWERKDSEAGIDVSDSGWDSEMVCMASIIDIKGKRYMFYNGNNYGKTGFGVAVLEG
jgi:hypothetical protein